MYKDIWTAAIGEELVCRREPTNSKDRYAVSVMKEENIIGHVPRKIAKICSLFLRRGGSLCCTVSGSRRYSADLPQGGFEIPCILLFRGESKEMFKLKKCLSTCGAQP